jgi:chromosome segregation ATPase
MAIDPALFVNLGVLAVTALLAYTGQRNKNDMNERIEKLRREIEKSYVPTTFDTERRQTILSRITENENEIKRNRESLHDLRGQFTQLIMGKLDRIESQLTDKVRHIANIENKLDSMDQLMHDFANRIQNIERSRRET